MNRPKLVLGLLTALLWSTFPAAIAHEGHTGPPDSDGNWAYCSVSTTDLIGSTGDNVWVSCNYGPVSSRVSALSVRFWAEPTDSSCGISDGRCIHTHTLQGDCTEASEVYLCVRNDSGRFRAAQLTDDGVGDTDWRQDPGHEPHPLDLCQVSFVGGPSLVPCEMYVVNSQHGFPIHYPPHSWLSPAGIPWANGNSSDPAISEDGRVVAFASAASNLMAAPPFGDVILPSDTNGVQDVYATDGDTVVLASFDYADWEPADGASRQPAVSDDGRYIAFTSAAANLVASDTNGLEDVFRFDALTGEILRVSRRNNGAQATGGDSMSPSISADGRYVAFASDATNLVGSADTNGRRDVFLRDLQLNTTTRISVTSAEAQATGGNSNNPIIASAAGFIVYQSAATNLVSGDTNNAQDVFLRSLSAGSTSRVSLRNAGGQATGGGSFLPDVSSDGSYVVFESTATDLVGAADTNGVKDIFVRNRTAATTTRISVRMNGNQTQQGNAASFDPAISNDGSYVTFATDATWNGLDPNGVTDVYERYQFDPNSVMRRISSPTSDTVEGAFLDAASTSPALSGDGQTVAFEAAASSVLTGQTRPQPGVDIYTHTWGSGRTQCQTELETAQRPVASSMTRDGTEEAVQEQQNSCDDGSHRQIPTNALPELAVHLTDGIPDSFIGTAIDPTVSPEEQPGALKFPMRNGRAYPVPPPRLWNGFGYFHVVAKHGWSAQERSEVIQVITAGIRINPQTPGSTRYNYEGLYFSDAHQTNCMRRVVVDMGPPFGGGASTLGVITTFAWKIA